jgi:hypothetical protein
MILDVLLGVCFFAAIVCILSLPWMLGNTAAADTTTDTPATLTRHHPSGKTIPTTAPLPEN